MKKQLPKPCSMVLSAVTLVAVLPDRGEPSGKNDFKTETQALYEYLKERLTSDLASL
jgi:hypothetical protein